MCLPPDGWVGHFAANCQSPPARSVRSGSRRARATRQLGVLPNGRQAPLTASAPRSAAEAHHARSRSSRIRARATATASDALTCGHGPADRRPCGWSSIGGSDAGISAALRARELTKDVEATVVVADDYPNFSICGLPFYVSGETPEWQQLAHRTLAELEQTGVRLLLSHTATGFDPEQARGVRAEPGRPDERPGLRSAGNCHRCWAAQAGHARPGVAQCPRAAHHGRQLSRP